MAKEGEAEDGRERGVSAVRPYYEVRPDDPSAREALNKLVGFDVHETERRAWAWIEDHAPRERNGRGEEHLSIPDPVEGEGVELTKVRALSTELSNSLANLKWMHGPERTAGRRWYTALEDLAKALDAFVPFARVRTNEVSYFASKVSLGGRDRYERIEAETAKVRALARNLAIRARAAQRSIDTYKDDPLPGLAPRKPHRIFLAGVCTRLNLAGFTFAEIGDLVPDSRRLNDEEQERIYVGSSAADGGVDVQAKLAAHRQSYRAEHAERIRFLVSGVRDEIVERRERVARGERALEAFMARTGNQASDLTSWFPEYLASPEALAVEAPGPDDPSAGE